MGAHGTEELEMGRRELGGQGDLGGQELPSGSSQVILWK